MPKLPFASSLLPTAQSRKRLVQEFAERSGMVYFGYVSQRSDDHHIVRGLTVSTKHVDDHYCIGTYDGYDVIFVERSDNLRSGKRHMWHILEFDLQSGADLPHVFIGSPSKGPGFHELLELKYPTMQPTTLGSDSSYPPAFEQNFGVYVTPTHALETERIITAEIAATMATHFVGMVMELQGQSLYVYSERPTPSAELFDTMLRNGSWLAQSLDQNSRR